MADVVISGARHPRGCTGWRGRPSWVRCRSLGRRPRGGAGEHPVRRVRQERRLIGRMHRRRGLSFQVVDVAVVSEHQKEGLGTIAVNTLMS